MFRIEPGPVVGLITTSMDSLCGGQVSELSLGSDHCNWVCWRGSSCLDVLRATAQSITAFVFRFFYKVITFQMP